MNSLIFQFYPIFLLMQILSTSSHKIPTLSPFHKEALILRNSAPNSDDLHTYYYKQTLDHFNYAPESYATFTQKYVVSSKYWDNNNKNLNSPIFAYLGAEDPLDEDLPIIGFLRDNAPHFKSLSVYIEHRFYGESIPFGTMEEAMKNKTIRGYFNSAQAIADYAEILLHVKKQFSAHNSPIIVVGGSYGGELASWFRLKYPHIALGAVASSSPILYFDNITPQNGYYSTVTKDFKEISESCYETIKKSWGEIDKVASESGGLSILSRRFKTCSHLNKSGELKDFLDSMYSVAAQYDHPPDYPVTLVCKGIDGAPKGTDVIGRIFAGVVSYRGQHNCYDTNTYNHPTQTNVGWGWQDIKLVLKRFGSNIIFSNGLRDPYSTGGVLEDLSESLVAVTTRNGSHCLDILVAEETDPEWLVMQRKREIKIIEGWLKTYYADLRAFSK